MLKYEEVKQTLLTHHFYIANETSKKIAMKSSLLSKPIYVNKVAGQAPSTLVIHPDYENLRHKLASINGVNSNLEKWYHSSNMLLFPKRQHKGKNPIGYGISFGFESELSLQEFLNTLKSPTHDLDNPFADIKIAESQLNTLSETTRDAVIKARVGQGPYREKLIDYWAGCAVTNCNTIDLLIASHSKPWTDSTNDERLDLFNGLLLTPNLDKVFDKGYITFKDTGEIEISNLLSKSTAETLGIAGSMKLRKIDSKHIPFLQWHRNQIFKK